MKISYNRLKEFIHLEESPEEVADLLTSIGLEVEGLDRFESVPGGMKGLVVGQVLEVWKHPDADKLSCTKVDIGSGEIQPIVCGAPNVAVGQKVIVATVGTTLYTPDGGSFEIKKAKIRGEVSQGMICAEDEIGVGESHDGIMVLPSDTAVGTPAAELFQIEADYVFEIGLTPNRADAASHFGVARDLKAALIERKGRKATLCRASVDEVKAANTDLVIPVRVENQEACPRYVGVTISNLTVQPSPAWLQNFLKAIGVRPINNVVDVTNYVNHAFGQPMHAFDADKIEGNEVVIKTMPKGSTFTTLDEEERTLDDKDLMICNAKEGMCIAGVFGGIKSGVTSETKNIFLESAYFDPVYIRKTAKRHGLSTDASFRFERGIDPNGTLYAAKLGAKMIAEYGGGTISSNFSDSHPAAFPSFQFAFRPKKANQLIGTEIAEATMERILESLEISIAEKKGDAWKLEVPPFKVDVTREADVIEEILRIYGYDEVPVSTKVLSTIKDMRPEDAAMAKEAVTKAMVANGFLECMSNSMTDEKFTALSSEWEADEIVRLNNPLSSELGVMRPALIFSALQNASYNLNRQQLNLKLFEFGNVYRVKSEGFKEEERLGILVSGQTMNDHWRSDPLDADWFEVKSAFEMVLQRLGIDATKLSAEGTNNDWFAYGMDWKKGDKVVASGGAISEKLMQAFDVKRPVFYVEMRWKDFVNMRQRDITIGQLPKYPEVRRDLALLIDDAVEYTTLERLAYQTERKLLKSVRLFDVYQGKGLPSGKKSYALAFNLRDENKTLTDKEVDKTMNRLQQRFEREVGAKLR
ncbi:MAG: phenylalanine--tRNA ligase subunit beta [Cryomorphaceae bacterium]